MSRNVVITGLGPITGFGPGMQPLWDGLLAGRSAIRRITRFDPASMACQVAAELDDELFNVKKIVPKSYRKATKVMCRDIELAVGGAAAAVEDAGLTTKATDPEAEPTYPAERIGCHIGAGLIAADIEELTAALVTSRDASGNFDLKHWGEQGMQNLTPLWLLKYLPNMLACHVTIIHDARGPSNTITCCESSGTLSLGESMRVIQRGDAEACLTGGTEYKLNPMAFFRQICANRLAHTHNGVDPATIVRPFDPEARGTVIGEGGGIIILEDSESAKARSANIYAEIAGFGATQSFCPDAVGLEIDPDDTGMGDAVELALEQAGLKPADIDAIVPLGLSNKDIDAYEAATLQRVFGNGNGRALENLPLITFVPNVGNCSAGHGAIAVAVAAKALAEQTLPGRLNTQNADGLDANACEARAASLNHVLVMTTGQGGQNAAVIVKRAE